MTGSDLPERNPQRFDLAGRSLWSKFMDELRHLHLGAPRPNVSVLAQLQSAYEVAMAGAGYPTPRHSHSIVTGGLLVMSLAKEI